MEKEESTPKKRKFTTKNIALFIIFGILPPALMSLIFCNAMISGTAERYVEIPNSYDSNRSIFDYNLTGFNTSSMNLSEEQEIDYFLWNTKNAVILENGKAIPYVANTIVYKDGILSSSVETKGIVYTFYTANHEFIMNLSNSTLERLAIESKGAFIRNYAIHRINSITVLEQVASTDVYKPNRITATNRMKELVVSEKVKVTTIITSNGSACIIDESGMDNCVITKIYD